MSPLAIISTLFSLFSSSSTSGTSQPSQAGSGRSNITENSDFSSSLSAQLAALPAPPANTPFGPVLNGSKASSSADGLKGSADLRSILDRLQSTQGLPPNWRKLTEHPEMAKIKDGVAAIQAAGQSLSGVNTSTDTKSIKDHLQTFAAKYNGWISNVDGAAKSDALQAGIQTLQDLGFNIDPNTGLASIDSSKLDALLASQKNVAVNSIRQFSDSFAKAIEPLNQTSNLVSIPSAYLNKALAAYAQTQHNA